MHFPPSANSTERSAKPTIPDHGNRQSRGLLRGPDLVALAFAALLTAGCQSTPPSDRPATDPKELSRAIEDGPSAREEEILAKLEHYKATGTAMQAANLDPTGLAKTAVMMESHRRFQAVSGDIPDFMEIQRQRALRYCRERPQLPDCKNFMTSVAAKGPVRPR